MKKQAIEEKIIFAIKEILEADDVDRNVDVRSSLIGKDPVLDSMGLVQLLLILEDFALDEHNFEFDWTSEKAMSAGKSIFKSVESLAIEYENQMNESL